MEPPVRPFDLATLDWSLVRSFTAVMRTGNLTRAARLLATTQPTVGRHIRHLEALTGEILFDRTANGLRPTQRAAALFEKAEALDDAVTAFALSLRGASADIAGTVRLTASLALGTDLLPGLLVDLLVRHPALEIELNVSDKVENLLRREADIAIRFGVPAQGDLIARKLGTLSLGLYASPAYLDRMGRGIPLAIADLADHVVIGDEEGRQAVAFGKRHGLSTGKTDVRLRSASMPTQLAAVSAGAGIGPALVCIARARPGLVRVVPGLAVATLPLWIVAHDDLQRSARMRAVFDHLVASLAGLVDQP